MDNTEALTPEEIAKKGEEIYQTKLKSQLEPKENGKYLVIDVMSGDYFLGESILEANEKAKAKYTDRLFYALKVGYKGIFKMGGYKCNASQHAVDGKSIFSSMLQGIKITIFTPTY